MWRDMIRLSLSDSSIVIYIMTATTVIFVEDTFGSSIGMVAFSETAICSIVSIDT